MMLGASLALQNYDTNFETLPKATAQLNSELSSAKNRFDGLWSKDLGRKILDNQYSYEDLESISDFDFTLYVYDGNDLVFWNRNDVEFPSNNLRNVVEGDHFIKLKNGYYYLIQTKRRNAKGDFKTIVGLYLLKTDYGIDQNKYLVNEKNPELAVSPNLDYDASYQVASVELKGPSYSLFGFLGDSTQWTNQKIWAFVLQCLFLLLSILLLYGFAINLAHNQKSHWGLLLLLFGLVGIRLLMHFINLPLNLGALAMFDKSFYRPELFVSPGNLLLIAILVFIFVNYIFHYVPLKFDFFVKTWGKQGTFFLGLLTFLFSFWLIVEFIRNLILYANCPFHISYVFELESQVCLLSVLLLIYSLFLFTRKLVKGMGVIEINLTDRIKIGVIIAVLFLISNWLLTFDFVTFLILFLVLSLAIFFPEFYKRETQRTSIGYILFWLFFGALITTLLIGFLQQKRIGNDLISYAGELVKQENADIESSLEDLSNSLLDDDILRTYFRTPFLPKQELLQRITQVYLGDSFSAFDKDLYMFDKKGKPLRGFRHEDKAFFDNRIKNQGIRTNNEYVFAMANPSGYNSYIIKIPVFGGNTSGGFMIIELSPKENKQNKVYPELVTREEDKLPESLANTNHAIYNLDEMETISGAYPYPTKLPVRFKQNKPYSFVNTDDGYKHLVYNNRLDTNRNKTVVVSKKKDSKLVWLSLLSFLFTMFFLCFIIYLIYDALVKKNGDALFHNLLFSSLRKRINTTMVFIIFFSFFVIGLITVIYFSNRSIQDHKEYLQNKQNEIQGTINYELGLTENQKLLQNNIKTEKLLENIAAIHSLDINLFDLDGNLIASSVPDLYTNGVVAKKMNPFAFFRFTNQFERKILQQENIGKLRYLSTYSEIKNKSGKVIAYLNVPYFARQKNLRVDIYNFLLALLNAYVLILLAASLLAFLLSNSLTRSLDLIGEKLQQIGLGRKNERLEWPQDDEIGALVEQYNTAIDELENSAQKLAKAEREFAWQQMAKQIAHEIKNPLTPMKLSIQHLQRAISKNDPNVRNLTMKVTDTLIEQIDHLAHIATEFSAFAQMPAPKEEIIELNMMLRGIVGLYDGNAEGVKIIEALSDKDIFVYADKSQLNRVFHNLTTNAIQAMGETEPAYLIVQLKAERGRVLISFQDNGSGIADEKKERVFYPNFTTKSSGMGLGLAISKNIVLNAGGQIWFDSTEGEGTTFFIELPQKITEEEKEVAE